MPKHCHIAFAAWHHTGFSKMKDERRSVCLNSRAVGDSGAAVTRRIVERSKIINNATEQTMERKEENKKQTRTRSSERKNKTKHDIEERRKAEEGNTGTMREKHF